MPIFRGSIAGVLPRQPVCVTDQSSHGRVSFLTLPELRSPEVARAALIVKGSAVCMVCGRSGPFLDFPRGGKRDRSRDRSPDSASAPCRAVAGGHHRGGAGTAPRDRGTSAPGGVARRSRLRARANSTRMWASSARCWRSIRVSERRRLWHMLRERGCTLSRAPGAGQGGGAASDAARGFLRRRTFPAAEGQVDWASFGHVMIGRARRALSAFLLTLTYSRWIFLRFFLDQSMENFLRGHVYAFADLPGVPRHLLYDNLRSAVLVPARGCRALQSPSARAGGALSLRAAGVSAGAREREGRGRAERAVRARLVLRRALVHDDRGSEPPGARVAGRGRGRTPVARRRPQDGGRGLRAKRPRTCSRCPSIPSRPTSSRPSRSHKTIYVRFDLNDYSIPPGSVGRPLTLIASETTVRVVDGARRGRSSPPILRPPPPNRGPGPRRSAAR